VAGNLVACHYYFTSNNFKMKVGLNTKGLFPDNTTAQMQELINECNVMDFRFPGGADAANRYSFVASGGLTAPPKLVNSFGDNLNPFAFADNFRRLLNPQHRVAAVLNLNRHMQTTKDVWYSKNMQLLSDLGMVEGKHQGLIELGNEIYMDKTITGIRTVPSFERAAKKYASLCASYVNWIRACGINAPIAVCMAEEENKFYKAWNNVLRKEFGNSLDYAYHYYGKPANVSKDNIKKILLARIGIPMANMHLTEANWKYQPGDTSSWQTRNEFLFNLHAAADEIGFRSLYWFKLGDYTDNAYNIYRVNQT
jgi:hypothetical protein